MRFAASLFRRAVLRLFQKKREAVSKEPREEGNPFLPQIREIMEQVLEKRGIPYERFAPVILDGNDSADARFAAGLLSGDLNRLAIVTDRSECFLEFAKHLYEEQGLIVQILSRSRETLDALLSDDSYGNVILDFEDSKEAMREEWLEKKTYIPIFKRRWEDAGNLDIAVPIGYNTLIVRGSETAGRRGYPDKFEQAFYSDE